MGALDAARRRLAADPRKRAWWHRLRHPALLVARRSTEPLSHNWGFERGTPIDRYYIERFLERHRVDIRGRVLEVKDDGYTRRYGTGVERADVLDIDAVEPAGDGGRRPRGRRRDPRGRLRLLRAHADPPPGLRRRRRRPAARTGPSLRAASCSSTVPALSRMCGDPETYPDYWRFTAPSARRLSRRRSARANVEVHTAGNALAGAAFLLGMAADELGARRLDAADPSHPVLVTIRAVKAATDRGSAI